MRSLLDQSDLTDLAERLVGAARKAGADQADALAVRSVSLSVEVRDGAVEDFLQCCSPPDPSAGHAESSGRVRVFKSAGFFGFQWATTGTV